MSLASKRRHQGIVLVITLIMLAMISMLAALSLRNAASSEGVSSAARVTELATQAAEIALRHCESMLLAQAPHLLPEPAAGTPGSDAMRWQDTETWDRASEPLVVLPLDAVNQNGKSRTFRRPPECLAEPLLIAQKDPVPPDASMGGTETTTTTMTTTPRIAAFVITARGFGPEVPAVPSHGRPQGTEVWLQSHIELSADPATAPRVLWRAWRQLFMR